MLTKEQIAELLRDASCRGSLNIPDLDLDYFVAELNNLIGKEIGTVNGDEFEEMFQQAGAHR